MTGENSDKSSAESASWDAVADWWKERTDSQDLYRMYVHGPALTSSCGDVSGLDVLDVGCGSGYFSRELACAGATVTAFDYSENLVVLAIAQEESNPLGIRYERLDAALIADRFESQKFDLVTGCMSIADIDDLDVALAGIRDVLKPGGKFCFSLPHPLVAPPENNVMTDPDSGIRGRFFGSYFGRRRVASGLNRVKGKPTGPEIKVWHMPISDWQELLAEFGFTITKLLEPYPSVEQVREHPGLVRLANVPEFMVIAAVRT